MPVQFANLRLNNVAPALSVEEAFRLAGSWSGIHDFQFDRQIFLGSFEVDGGSSGAWTPAFIDGLLPSNFVMTYHKVNTRQGIIIRCDAVGLYWLICTDASGHPALLRSGVFNTLYLPNNTPTEADVTIVFQQQRFTDDADDLWRTVSVYMNDALVLSYAEQNSVAADNIKIGFAAYDSDTISYTDIAVPELCEIAEFLTLDPGEYPTGGLARTLDGRYVKWFIRHDGSLRAWRKRQRDLLLSITVSQDSLKLKYDPSSLTNHVRMAGAYVFGNSKDDDLIRAYGDRFAEVNNQMLLTQPECDDEAVREIKRSEENAFGVAFDAQHIPVLEPEDRIGVNGQSWVVNDYQWSIAQGEIQQTINARRYVWG